MRTLASSKLTRYGAALMAVMCASAAALPFRAHVNVTTVALGLLLAVLLVAIVFGSKPALAASVFAMLCFNFFFLPPYHTLTIADPQNWVALTAFFIVMSPEQQAKLLGDAWERLSIKPQERIRFRVISPDEAIRDFYLGAHPPDLTDEEINFIHKLWLDVRDERGLEAIRHKQIVVAALVRLADELYAGSRQRVLDLLRTMEKGPNLYAARPRRSRKRLLKRSGR